MMKSTDDVRTLQQQDVDRGLLLKYGPLILLPVAAMVLGCQLPPWIFMWLLAASIYAGFKWYTFARDCVGRSVNVGRSFAYLAFWPGMDAQSFCLSSRTTDRPTLTDWWSATATTAMGFVLLIVAVQWVDVNHVVCGWLGMIGIVATLHFGVFGLISNMYRSTGVVAKPIMNRPLRARSLAEFWGRRWNVAFRDLAYSMVFRPLVGTAGTAKATLAVFILSGLIHDLVISVPARGGYGLPTLYFLIQGLGILWERRMLGKQTSSRAWFVAVTTGPLFLLFHPPFVERVMIPMLYALKGGVQW